MIHDHSCRAAPPRAARLCLPVGSPQHLAPPKARPRILLLTLLLAGAGACAEPPPLEVEIEAVRLAPADTAAWARPAVESGHDRITVRQIFTAQGPCRHLDARLMRRYPGEFLLRVEAREVPPPCGDTTPHLGYTALLRGLPVGSHRLRIVHVGADGRTLAEAVLEHPIVVTNPRGE